MLIQKFGTKAVFGYSQLVTNMCSLCIPQAASIHYRLLIVLQSKQGRERETMAALNDLRPTEENNVPSLNQPKYCFRSLQVSGASSSWRGRVKGVIIANERRIESRVLVIRGCWQLNHGDYGNVHREHEKETRERQKVKNPRARTASKQKKKIPIIH
ncbi:hypothetical protein J6590_062977 [Homalodisca vitripennis]|nr:hypothetical protein J6590_062977 [Homalodisca vitripennis]